MVAMGSCRMMKQCVSVSSMLAMLGLAAGPALAATDLADLSLENLLAVPVVGASKYDNGRTRWPPP